MVVMKYQRISSQFISALREKRGLSQYQLSALVGVSDKAVSKWENGSSTPRIGTIRKLAEISLKMK